MRRYKSERLGPRKPSNEVYSILDAFAVVCRVDQDQGFIKRHEGFFNKDNTRTDDNQTASLKILRDPAAMDMITDEDREAGKQLFEFFREKLVYHKLADDMTDYNRRLDKILVKTEIDANSDLGMLASLPNSKRITNQRQQMSEIFEQLITVSEYISTPKKRLELEVEVLEVKWLPRSCSYIITSITDDKSIAKFFLQKATVDDTDLATLIAGKRIQFVGTVRSQEPNVYTNCKETMFNRVKIKKCY